MSEDQETPEPTLREVINQYYALRGLVPPNDSESLLWLISEIGELVDAWLYTKKRHLSPDARYVFNEAITLGKRAELAVAKNGKEWVRNQHPKHEIELGGEIGDVLMMLDRFSNAIGYHEPEVHLRLKMRYKLQVLGLI